MVRRYWIAVQYLQFAHQDWDSYWPAFETQEEARDLMGDLAARYESIYGPDRRKYAVCIRRKGRLIPVEEMETANRLGPEDLAAIQEEERKHAQLRSSEG
jgi:hypothetical protein